MRKALLMLVLMLGMVCVALQEFKYEFKAGGDGRPEGWKVYGVPEKCAVKDGVVTLSGDSKGDIFILNPNVELSKDVTYILSCEAKCVPGGDYMIYYEYIMDGKW